MQAKEGEITPYGITQVHALDVDDSQVSNRKVCVIDSGYDLGHPDLQTMNINGTDLHPNPGYNGSTAWSEDQSGHGTHVAGTIAAIGNNNIGVQGVVRNGQMNLHIIRAFGSDGLGAWKSRMIIAVQSCVDSKSNVVSMSWSGQYPSQLEEDAFEDWVNNDDVLFVAAAGNSNNTEYAYPASYDSVLSVAAVDESGDIASFSTSNDQVDIAAPGVAVLSTVPRALGQE
jgi:serine protease